MISLRRMASIASRTTVRTWTTLSARSVMISSERLNSSAMMTVKIIPKTPWNTACSVGSNFPVSTRLNRIFSVRFQTAATMTTAIRPVRKSTTACSNFWYPVSPRQRTRAAARFGLIAVSPFGPVLVAVQSPCPPLCPPRVDPGLHRPDAVLAPGALDALGPGHLEGSDQRGTGLAGIDHVVDQGGAGGDVGIDQPAEVLHPAGALVLRVLGGGDLLAVDDVRAALGAHHADHGRRPRHDEVRLVGVD